MLIVTITLDVANKSVGAYNGVKCISKRDFESKVFSHVEVNSLHTMECGRTSWRQRQIKFVGNQALTIAYYAALSVYRRLLESLI